MDRSVMIKGEGSVRGLNGNKNTTKIINNKIRWYLAITYRYHL